MKKNSIVFIMSSLGFGGAERVVSSLCNWIVNNTEDNVSIIKFDNKDNAYELDKRINVVSMINIKKNRISAIIERYKFCKDNLKQLNATIVVAMFYQTEIYAKLSKPKGCVLIGSERANINERSYISKVLSKHAAKKCTGFIFQTNGIKECYQNSVQKQSVVIPNAISNKKVYEIDYSKIKKENVITAMGRLDEQKGFDVLINAFKEVYNRHPEYKLKIFGNGLEKNKLQELINKLGLSENVILCGANQDAIFEVAKSKIYVLSSRYEGMPNALIEAMAAGTACISTDCKFGPSELINDGKNGLLIPVDDVRTLSEKILFLIKNDSARENIEKEAMKIRKKLDANTIYKKYYDYFVGVKNEK